MVNSRVVSHNQIDELFQFSSFFVFEHELCSVKCGTRVRELCFLQFSVLPPVRPNLAYIQSSCLYRNGITLL